MDYVLRKAKSSDAIRIEELFVEMLKGIYHTDAVKGYEIGYLDKFFSDREDWICVAEYKKNVVAFLSIEVYRDEDYIYLDDLSVAEGFRNKGIGAKLIQAAEKYAEKIGITRIALHVEKTNKDAYQFYLRFGYSEAADEISRFRMNKFVMGGNYFE